jgi:hypothetical protein
MNTAIKGKGCSVWDKHAAGNENGLNLLSIKLKLSVASKYVLNYYCF